VNENDTGTQNSESDRMPDEESAADKYR